MQQPDESPSTEEILASLLDFFAAAADQQVLRLNQYRQQCVEHGLTPHLHDPLVELAEGLYDYCGSSSTVQEHEESFFVGPLPHNVVSVMHELSRKIDSMLTSDQQKLFAVELLNQDEWQIVRQLAGEGLKRWGLSRPQAKLNLYDLMCQVAD